MDFPSADPDSPKLLQVETLKELLLSGDQQKESGKIDFSYTEGYFHHRFIFSLLSHKKKKSTDINISENI